MSFFKQLTTLSISRSFGLIAILAALIGQVGAALTTAWNVAHSQMIALEAGRDAESRRSGRSSGQGCYIA